MEKVKNYIFRRTAVSILIAIALIFSAGCVGVRNLKPVEVTSDVNCSGIQYPEAGGMVFRDSDSWEAFWGEYCMVIDGEGNQIPPPDVGFSTHMLIGVFAGTKPTSGYSITIERVREDAEKLVVEYSEDSPPPDAMLLQVITYPCHLVSISLSDKTVEFKPVEK